MRARLVAGRGVRLARASSPRSSRHAASHTSSRAPSISIAMSASLKAIACLRRDRLRRRSGAPWRSRARPRRPRARRRRRARRARRGRAAISAAQRRRPVAAEPRRRGHAHALERELDGRQRQHSPMLRSRRRRRAPARRAARGTPASVPCSAAITSTWSAAVEPRHEALRAVEHDRRRRRARAPSGGWKASKSKRGSTNASAPGHEASARRRRGQDLLSLLGDAEVRDREADEAGREDREGEGEVAPAELLRDQRAGHGAALAAAAARIPAARSRRDRARGRAASTLGRRCPRLVALARPRADLVRGELPHGLDDELLLFARLEVDHCVSPRILAG